MLTGDKRYKKKIKRRYKKTEEAGIEPAAAQLQPTVLKTAGTTRFHLLPGSSYMKKCGCVNADIFLRVMSSEIEAEN